MEPAPGSLQWWYIVLSIGSIFVGLGLTVLGRGFALWSERLKEMAKTFDNRLSHMEHAANERWKSVESRFDKHEDRVHTLHIQIEKRVTYLEAKTNGADHRE